MPRRDRRWPRRACGVILALGALAAGCGDEGREATIDDEQFVADANAVCQDRVAELRAGGEGSTPTTVLRPETIDGAADGLADVLADLRRLPVEPDDQAEVDRWLENWRRYVEVGHRYADAVRSGDPERYTAVDDEAVRLARRIGRFGRANGIDECVL